MKEDLDRLKKQILGHFGYTEFPPGRKGPDFLLRALFVNLALNREIVTVYRRGGPMKRGSRDDNAYNVLSAYLGKHRSTIPHIVYSHETYMLEEMYAKAWKHFSKERV